MKRILVLTIALTTGLPGATVFAAGIDASAVLTSTPVGSNFDYAITLTNSSSSTDPIGTFWFAWVPGKDFMPTSPFNISAPAGWVEKVTGGGAGDGFAIQFVDSTGPLIAPGSSLSGFTFTSASTPAQLAGDSPFYPGTPALTSTVYNGKPFSSVSDQFVAAIAPVPEPSSLILGVLGAVTTVGYSLYRTRRG